MKRLFLNNFNFAYPSSVKILIKNMCIFYSFYFEFRLKKIHTSDCLTSFDPFNLQISFLSFSVLYFSNVLRNWIDFTIEFSRFSFSVCICGVQFPSCISIEFLKIVLFEGVLKFRFRGSRIFFPQVTCDMYIPLFF